MMDKKIIIGLEIKKKRKEKNLKQNDVSVQTGLSRNYISDIENGRYMPSVESLSKLALCLSIDLNTLILSEIQDTNNISG